MGGTSKLTGTEAQILELLAESEELYGLEMIAKSRSLKRGTIYVILDRLEDKGLVSSREMAPPAGSRGPSRRMYRLTGMGARVLEANRLLQAAWSGSFAEGST
jgi:DNA-binding PadR family transcriptional regulator